MSSTLRRPAICARTLRRESTAGIAALSGMPMPSASTIEAMEEAVPAYVLSAALFARYRSRVEHTFGDQVLSAMRFGFGGHVEMPQ